MIYFFVYFKLENYFFWACTRLLDPEQASNCLLFHLSYYCNFLFSIMFCQLWLLKSHAKENYFLHLNVQILINVYLLDQIRILGYYRSKSAVLYVHLILYLLAKSMLVFAFDLILQNRPNIFLNLFSRYFLILNFFVYLKFWLQIVIGSPEIMLGFIKVLLLFRHFSLCLGGLLPLNATVDTITLRKYVLVPSLDVKKDEIQVINEAPLQSPLLTLFYSLYLELLLLPMEPIHLLFLTRDPY